MRTGRCLGLVGGLGIGATAYYYEKLAGAHEAQNRTLDLVITHAEISRVFAYAQADDRNGMAEYLAGHMRRMQAAGAEVVAIPAVTPHCCIAELMAISPLPVVSIFEPLREELRARAARRVAIFGTRVVIKSSLFGQLPDVEVIQSRPEETDYIHNTYIELARTGKASEEQHAHLTALAHKLVQRDRVDTILLAGTDLALFFDETNTDFPNVDCAALHLRAILKQLLDDPMPKSR